MSTEQTELAVEPPAEAPTPVVNPYGVLAAAPTGAAAMALVGREIASTRALMQEARANPRDERLATDRILTACSRLSLAEHAIYSYVKGGTEITGASIRLAEEIRREWGNMDAGVDELTRFEDKSEAMAFAVDLEKLTRERKVFTVKHWRDTKAGGYRVRDEREIYETIANAGARRKRACILALIPADVQEAALRQCEATLATKVKLTPERLNNMVEMFGEFGVTREALEKRIQRRLDSMTPALFVQLSKIFTSLKENMSRPADWFELEPGAEAAPTKGNEGVKAKLAERRAKKAPE